LLAVIAVELLILATATSDAASVETSCIGYARAVADHLRPAAPKGSPEYRAVYFPTLEECRRRGGSAAMPGGMAAAPWYRPAPPAPSANPYNPAPPASPPASSSGLPRPPAPPVGSYTPTPAAPPPAAGATPQQILAEGRRRIEQTLPGGMSFPAAVKAAMEGCGVYAIQQADAAAGADDGRWAQIASASIETCIARGGAINGTFVLSRHLELALRMAKYKSAPFGKTSGITGSHACVPVEGEPDYQNCVNDRGQWFICYQGQCMPVDAAVFVVDSGPSEGTTVFFSCPGGSCLRPNTEGPRAQPNPFDNPVFDRRKATIDRMREECGKRPNKLLVHSCAIDICIKTAPPGMNNVQLAQYCSEIVFEATGTTIASIVEEYLGVTGKFAQTLANIALTRITVGLEITLHSLGGLTIFSEPFVQPNRYVTFGTMKATVFGLWMGITEYVWDIRHLPCRSQPELCDGSTIVGVVAPNGVMKGSGAQYFTVAQWCRQRVTDLMQASTMLDLSASERSAIADAAVETCIARTPADEEVRGLFAAMAISCVKAGGTGADIREWSGGAAACLARLPQQGPADGVYQVRLRLGDATAALDYVLRNCAVSAGARWRGMSAEVIPGRTPPLPEFSRRVQGCVLEQVATIRLSR
jgi:hypothetical protein